MTYITHVHSMTHITHVYCMTHVTHVTKFAIKRQNCNILICTRHFLQSEKFGPVITQQAILDKISLCCSFCDVKLFKEKSKNWIFTKITGNMIQSKNTKTYEEKKIFKLQLFFSYLFEINLKLVSNFRIFQSTKLNQFMTTRCITVGDPRFQCRLWVMCLVLCITIRSLMSQINPGLQIR